jgi:hypothetical protein
MIKRTYKKTSPFLERYIVVNQDGGVFVGLRGGYPQYSSNWGEAKPLFIENTSYLLKEKGTELIKESEL